MVEYVHVCANLGIGSLLLLQTPISIYVEQYRFIISLRKTNLPDAMLMVSTDPNMINSYSGEIRLEAKQSRCIREQGVHSSGTAQPAVFCGVSILRSKVLADI